MIKDTVELRNFNNIDQLSYSVMTNTEKDASNLLESLSLSAKDAELNKTKDAKTDFNLTELMDLLPSDDLKKDTVKKDDPSFSLAELADLLPSSEKTAASLDPATAKDESVPKKDDSTTSDAAKKPDATDQIDLTSEPKEESKDAKAEPEAETKNVKEESSDDTTQDTSKEGEEAAPSTLIKSNYEVRVKLADMQADPDSPLYSVKSFEELGLSPELLNGLFAMKFTKPSKIQEKALPLLLSNPPRNMIGQSQSGTGKTAAFSLTMLSRVDVGLKKPQCICISPTRELARQTLEVVETMGKYTGISTQLVVPESLGRGQGTSAQILVATPGIMIELIRKRKIDVSNVKVYVLDEADNMLDAGGLSDSCIRVKQMLPRSCQLVLFSATFPDKVRTYAEELVPNANSLTLKEEELNVDGIKQMYMDCKDENHKFEVLCELYSLLTIGSSIIFCETRRTADELRARMTAEGHICLVMHGALDVHERDRLTDDFREGRSKVLITTNVLARGIDIPTVSMVVNYDIPTTMRGLADPSTYLHRIGRTGRFGRVGVAISFVHNRRSFGLLMDIERYFGNLKIIGIKTDDFDEVERQVKQVIKN